MLHSTPFPCEIRFQNLMISRYPSCLLSTLHLVQFNSVELTNIPTGTITSVGRRVHCAMTLFSHPASFSSTVNSIVHVCTVCTLIWGETSRQGHLKCVLYNIPLFSCCCVDVVFLRKVKATCSVENNVQSTADRNVT